MKPLAAPLVAVLLACSCAASPPRPDAAGPASEPTPPGQDDEALRQRIKELEADLARQSGELARVRTELFAMRLKEVRGERPADETDFLRREGLLSDHPELRIAALRVIAALPADRQAAFVPQAAAGLAGGNPASRAEAVSFLSRIDSADARRAVLSAVRDAAPEVRRAAAIALRTAEGVDALVSLLADPVRDVRAAAVESLGAARAAGAVAPLIRLLHDERESTVLEKAIDALGSIGAPEAAAPILDLLKTASTDGIRFSTITALGKIGDSRAAPFVRPYLAKPHADPLREIAMDAAGKLKDADATPELLKVLRDPEDKPRLRAQAARSLGLLGACSELGRIAAAENQDVVRRAAWTAALEAAGDSVDKLLEIADGMLRAGRRAEAEEACARLHARPLAPSMTSHEERAAAAAIDARDWRAALAHLARLAPDLRRARCHRELGEFDAALKGADEAAARATKGSADWWSARLDRLATLESAKRHVDAVREASELRGNDAPAEVNALHHRCAKAILDDATSADAEVRARALEAVRGLGRAMLGPIADAVEAPAKLADRPALIEAGNAAAGTTFDPKTTDEAEIKKIAAAWRAKP